MYLVESVWRVFLASRHLQELDAGALPSNHWLKDPVLGGGRMVGEGCHFIDLMSFLVGDHALVSIQADCTERSAGLAENFVVQLKFADGSVGQLLYTANGCGGMGKERLELFAGGVSALLDDYRTAEIHGVEARPQKLSGRGKGHAEEIAALLAAVRSGGPSPIDLDVLLGVSRATFAAHRCLARDSGQEDLRIQPAVGNA